MLNNKPDIWNNLSHLFGTSNGKTVSSVVSNMAIKGIGSLTIPKIEPDIEQCGIDFGKGMMVTVENGAAKFHI